MHISLQEPYFLKLIPLNGSGSAKVVDLVAACDRDEENGVVLARTPVEISEIMHGYHRALSSLQEWAARQGEAEYSICWSV